jgi:hypothetical protein
VAQSLKERPHISHSLHRSCRSNHQPCGRIPLCTSRQIPLLMSPSVLNSPGMPPPAPFNPRMPYVAPVCTVLASRRIFICLTASRMLYVYTTNANVNPKSLPPHSGEICRGASHDQDRSPAFDSAADSSCPGFGETLKQVWQRLSEDRLDMSCETFCRLVRRARAKPHTSAAPSGKSIEEPAASTQATGGNIARDPLANLKRLKPNRPGFRWQATPKRRDS